MTASQITVGGRYVAKVSDVLTIVVVTRIDDDYQYARFDRRATTRYYVRNESTGRETVFRSAAKFRRPA